jgi:hypothetical protein
MHDVGDVRVCVQIAVVIEVLYLLELLLLQNGY